MALYTNNFKGRAGRTERAKHLVDEFKAIEDAFTRLQALNISTYLTTHVNTTGLSGTITIRPDNGFIQELTLTADAAIQLSAPLNESQYRVALLIHGNGLRITNLWGAQTWKEYGQDNWWYLYTGDGPYASMLLDFFWDICSNTWICVASSKNIVPTVVGGEEQRFYPLLCNLSNVEGDDTLGFTRSGNAMGIDQNQVFHYFVTNEPRFMGARYVENWCATASDLTSAAWVDTDCTVTTDAGAGPVGENVQRLSFDVTGGKLAHFILPSFGRASTAADPIKVAVSFKGRGVAQNESVRVRCAFMGKAALDPPVHDQVQVNMDTTWQTYGCILNVTKDGNANYPLTLDREYPRTLLEVAFVSPSGSAGGDIQITDVQIEVLREFDGEYINEVQDTTIGGSITLSGTGTGTWVDGTKTLTLASVGQSVDLSGTLEIGKTYLVHAQLTAGDAADIRMQNNVTVWAAGNPSSELYLQDAPFTFQYDGGQLNFVLLSGSSSIYTVNVYEVSNNRDVYCYSHPTTAGLNGALTDGTPEQVSSGVLDGVAREIAATNEISFAYFRTFSAWDQAGLTGESANSCRNPVFQSEYGIDGWPARATILQGASRYTDGFIQRTMAITPASGGKDFQMWIRRTLDFEGNQIVTPQHNDVTVPISRYVDFEAELTGGTSTIESGRIRLDIQTGDFTGLPSGYNYVLGIFRWGNWWMVNIRLTNDGSHDTFRVRVYPSSGTTADPADIDVTNTGWVIIDWAHFEDETGTFVASSPIVGGETRNTENFTSGLPDGDFYETTIYMSLQENGHVATLTTGSVIWDREDGVYRNLLYSSELLVADPNVRNMHEFGLVAAEAAPATLLTILTTTLYPVEVTDSFQLSADISGGSMSLIPIDSIDGGGDILSVVLNQILLTTGPYEDSIDGGGDVLSVTLYQILLTAGPNEDSIDGGGDVLSVVLQSKLVTGDTPDEELQLTCDINPSGCSMTPI